MKPKKKEVRYICPQCGFISTDTYTQLCQKCDGVNLQAEETMFKTIRWLMREGLIDPDFRKRRAARLLTFIGFTPPEADDKPWTRNEEEYWL